MAVGHWFSFDKPVAGLQGIYTPLAEPREARRAGRHALGIPEIYFAKAIDNSRLLKVSDPRRNREMAMFFCSVACFFVLLMVYALQHFSAIEYGYKIEAQKKQREELIEANRGLRLEEASLRDPERIDVLARRIGLQSPQAGQLQRLEVEVDPSAPMLAKAANIAVVVAQ
jgi:hypothetical protein